ncbi:tyrosinase [Cladorrhinum sp. PSN259]|nr:tyrosinase [Cladorrhinum sp. PSN259]
MFTFQRPVSKYQVVPPEDSASSDGGDLEAFGHEKRSHLLQKWSQTSRRSRILIIITLSTILTLCISAGTFQLGYTIGSQKFTHPSEHLRDHDLQLEHPSPKAHQGNQSLVQPALSSATETTNKKTCTNLVHRQEWRSLSQGTKKSYLDAVNCLAHTPSVLGHLGTVYDDFPWVHLQMAHNTHGNASFLSWHRRFIHLYELYLQQLCGYNGSLPYWDWTLDWESLRDSPVFSTTILGFGGDGDLRLPVTVGGGRCVTNGALAGHLRPQLYGNKTNPHCLSRGFNYSNSPIEALSPAAVERVLEAKDYKSFLLGIENGAHNAIPNAVKGDFFSFTAPYDPLSILHHAQLDRLWLQWQQRDASGARFNEYGPTRESSQASLEDSLWMGGLEHNGDVLVRDVMDPGTGDLCYRYA